MRDTILTEKDNKLLEELIVKRGKVVSIDNIMDIFGPYYSEVAAHNRVHRLTKLGWLKRLKRGLYLVIENLSSRFQTDLSLVLISNALNETSYVSLSYALNYYQMFDQYTNTIVAITNKETKEYSLDDFTFKFAKVKESMFFGFSEKIVAGKSAKIADAEKALIDYLYLDKTFSSANLVFEKLREHNDILNINLLQEYVLKTDISLQRKFGFLLDQLNMDSVNIYQNVKGHKGLARFTRESKNFNAKWRVYYDDRIIG